MASNNNNNNNNNNTKSKEELEAERQQAQEQLNALLKTSKPKNLSQGLSQGVGNIVGGALGAVGVAVLMPTLGAASGMRSGGAVGGILGLAGGAVVGALGAVALGVAGAVSGVVQMGQGVAAVPQQIVAPRQGKWWNEMEGQWVATNLETDPKALLDKVPDDDSDLLGSIQSELDQGGASVELGAATKSNVQETYYYDQLEVEVNADQHTIKRRYYVLARKYHPDKHPGDVEAAEKFKAVAEAYQVLSDPELRKKYNKDGRAGLSPDKTDVDGTGGAPKVDSKILFAFLFGSDQFADITGPLATATSASIGDSPKVSVAVARTLQKRRVLRLAMKLAQRVDPYVEQRRAGGATEESVAKEVTTVWSAQAEELVKASFGHQLITTIGSIYNVMASFYEGSLDNGQGLPSLSKWAVARRAKLDQNRAATTNKMQTLQHGMNMMKLQAEMQQKMAACTTDEEKQKVTADFEGASMEVMLQILWTTTVVDLTSTLHEVCHMVFYDQSVDKQTRAHRAEAVRILGKVWMEYPAPPTLPQEEKNAKQMYEEAAFAAMLETIKRKDEAAHGQQQQ